MSSHWLMAHHGALLNDTESCRDMHVFIECYAMAHVSEVNMVIKKLSRMPIHQTTRVRADLFPVE